MADMVARHAMLKGTAGEMAQDIWLGSWSRKEDAGLITAKFCGRQ